MNGTGARGGTTVVLSVGSNLGDRADALCSVLDAAAATGGLRGFSSVYLTPPWGGVPQEDYLNAVLVVTGARGPREWLDWAHQLERARDRRREVRWGPRTLDVDLVQVRMAGGTGPWGAGPGGPETHGAELTCTDDELTLPHPRAAERAFVLVPWAEVEPGAELAGCGVQQWLDALDPGERAGVRPAPPELTGRWPHPVGEG